MEAPTLPAVVVLVGSFLFVAATPLIEARADPAVINIEIEIDDKLKIISGTTDMGSDGSHIWGPEVIGAHPSIWIAGIGEPDAPAGGTSATATITKQSFVYEGFNVRGSDSAAGPVKDTVHGRVSRLLSQEERSRTDRVSVP
jgi:hypothetical protein